MGHIFNAFITYVATYYHQFGQKPPCDAELKYVVNPLMVVEKNNSQPETDENMGR